MHASEFVAKWKGAELSERSACQQHFLDLCDLVEHPKPAEVDKTGETFTFEKGVRKYGAGHGFADVWKRGFFGWEYKKKRADLERAYSQLLLYRADLENPPLLVVCDMDAVEIHTNFTGAPEVVHRVTLDDIALGEKLDLLRAVFHDPEKLRPGRTSESITAEAAQRIAEVAQRLRDKGEHPHRVARFLDRLVFCMFAEDIGLLQDRVLSGLLERRRDDPARFAKALGSLFEAMSAGGDFGLTEVRHFNGNLFDSADVLPLESDDLGMLYRAARLDWSAVDPSIFGTLFERGLDPAKRAQLGAHYTSREDIETLVEPVVMLPLRREWGEIRQVCENLLATGRKKPTGKEKPPSGAALTRARNAARGILNSFIQRLARVKVLDPACGSGNFLYVTLQKLKDLEKEVIVFGAEQGLGAFLPFVGPWQLYGIEISPYAHELAQMTVWIGYLQWTRYNGFGWPQDPVLRPMNNILNMDAILPSVAQAPLAGVAQAPPPADVAQAPPPAGTNSREDAPSVANDSQPGAAVLQHGNGTDTGEDAPPVANDSQPGAAVLQDGNGSHPGAGVLHGGAPNIAKPTNAERQRNLPHIENEGKTYFITFCTWRRLRLPEKVRGLVLRHCLHDHGSKVHVHGVVVMPDHVHMIITPLFDDTGVAYGLSEIMNGIKGASAHSVNKALGRKGSLWQAETFDHILRSDESAEQKVIYICENPVRKNLVRNVDAYPWLWREWEEGYAADAPAAQRPSAADVAQAPPPADVAQAPPPAETNTKENSPPGRERPTAGGGCATCRCSAGAPACGNQYQ